MFGVVSGGARLTRALGAGGAEEGDSPALGKLATTLGQVASVLGPIGGVIGGAVGIFQGVRSLLSRPPQGPPIDPGGYSEFGRTRDLSDEDIARAIGHLENKNRAIHGC